MVCLRIRDYGITIGQLPTGSLNRISDVPGVTVGHATISDAAHNTGVTVVLPCKDNPFAQKLPCASFVLNGFGKTAGLVQIEELGTLETPIALTNTLNVGLVHDAMVEYMIQRCKADGIALRSVNPVVCECNDAALNDIQHRAVKQEHVFAAIESACAAFEEGAVGCGRGMTCHGLKGGVGSASRRVALDGDAFTVGVLVQTNHGKLRDLLIHQQPVGMRIYERVGMDKPDKGSCIVILATGIPLSDRQLRRVIKRCSVGLARLGSFIGQSSGEVFIGFSTANRVPDAPERAIMDMKCISDACLDPVFRAAAECTEESVLNSLTAAEDVTGFNATTRVSLNHFMNNLYSRQ